MWLLCQRLLRIPGEEREEDQEERCNKNNTKNKEAGALGACVTAERTLAASDLALLGVVLPMLHDLSGFGCQELQRQLEKGAATSLPQLTCEAPSRD